jgi:integrase
MNAMTQNKLFGLADNRTDVWATPQDFFDKLNAVFNFAIASGYTEKNPCILVGELIPEHEVQSYPCLPASEMPEFFRRLEQCNAFPITKVVLKLACFTGTRISELLKARWDSGEIDFENKVWLIPAYRMKRRKELMVPLSPQVYDLFSSVINLACFIRFCGFIHMRNLIINHFSSKQLTFICMGRK